MSQIDLFKNYLYLTGLCPHSTKALEKQLHEKYKYKCTLNVIP